MRTAARLRAAAVTAALMLGLAALARAPYTPPGADHAVLRLSWRLLAPASERCRVRTPEEMAALPAHMRAPEVCEREVARYRLVLRLDARSDTLELHGGGAKGDRPVFVLEERRLETAEHRLGVELHRVGSGGAGDARVANLDTTLTPAAGRVVLVTMEGDRLVVR